jgi:hypothetical protein
MPVMPTPGGDRKRWRVVRQEVRLDAAGLCPRFRPSPAVPFPTHVVVYDVRPDGWSERGELISVSSAEERAWADARRTYLRTLSRALEQLYRAHGGRGHVEVHLPGGWTGTGLRAPRRWPGWRKRAAARSERAQRAFLEQAAAAEQLYRPVRKRIKRCVRAARLEEKQRLKNLRRELTQQHRLRRKVWIVWDGAACAAVEQECKVQGVTATFGEWWDAVTAGRWRSDLAQGTWVTCAVPDPDTRPARTEARPHSHYHSYSGTIPTSGTF